MTRVHTIAKHTVQPIIGRLPRTVIRIQQRGTKGVSERPLRLLQHTFRGVQQMSAPDDADDILRKGGTDLIENIQHACMGAS